jgi:cytochrome c oxidase subunit 2
MNWLLAQTGDGGFWMPRQASTVSDDVDGVFAFIYWITAFFFVLILVLMLVLVIKYRHRPSRPDAERAPAHSTALELTWTIIPTVLVLMVFYFGFRGFLEMSVAPPNSYEIQVEASMWNWKFQYPNGVVSDQLHLPVGVPVRLVLDSRDVIHSLFVPQFRVKKDAVPGRFNRFWVQATQEGEFDIYCAEYCGQNHSKMLSKVIVHDLAGYRTWLDEAANWEKRMTPAEAGIMLLRSNGCIVCHSVDGSPATGPTFKDLWGRPEPLADGSSVIVDEPYFYESLYDPAAKVVRGYTVQMTTYKGRLKERDINAMIAYLKTISTHHKSVLPATAPTTR